MGNFLYKAISDTISGAIKSMKEGLKKYVVSIETYFLLSLQMVINALATGLNALNESYRSLFANYYTLAISAMITGVFVYILNKSIKDKQSVHPLCVGLAAFGFAMFMASLAALTKVGVVHYIHVNCFFACFFNYLRSYNA